MAYQSSFPLFFASGHGTKEFRDFYGNHIEFRRGSRLCAVLRLTNLPPNSDGLEIISGTLRPISDAVPFKARIALHP